MLLTSTDVLVKTPSWLAEMIDYLVDGEVDLILNTPSGKGARTDEGRIRAAAVQHGVPCITTFQAAEAAVRAMEALRPLPAGDEAAVPTARLTGAAVMVTA